ncbi:MAG: uroporphyrinogen-III C-methyltransferase [Pelomonas sp.]|nr:uroporphyrinogen-III C-methyltransferase [Roseateles sp.]
MPAAVVAGIVAAAALALFWQSHTRQGALEQELVSRQEASQIEAGQARDAARQAQDLARDSAAKVALLDAKVAEIALQREQLETLMQALSRSRDDNLVGDIESSVSVAQQQAAITGSAEPLVAALRQADERLQRYKQPRLEGVRRAVERDLDRIKSASVVDTAALTARLDEVARQVDELPLLAEAVRAPAPERAASAPRAAASRPAAAASRKAEPAGPADETRVRQWWASLRQRWDDMLGLTWNATHDLVRVSRIDHPEAMLLAPEQGYFLRENLKLRLLNARLALLSRQFDTAQADLRVAQDMLGRYFDARSREVVASAALLRQVAGLAHQVDVPRPDDTLAALAAAAAH